MKSEKTTFFLPKLTTKKFFDSSISPEMYNHVLDSVYGSLEMHRAAREKSFLKTTRERIR